VREGVFDQLAALASSSSSSAGAYSSATPVKSFSYVCFRYLSELSRSTLA
jgi:hypothetical protein